MTNCTHKYRELTQDTAYCPACSKQFTAADLVEVVRELQEELEIMEESRDGWKSRASSPEEIANRELIAEVADEIRKRKAAQQENTQ